MNKIKKILKSFLAASLFVVGLVCNPLSIKAEEAGTYAAPSQPRTDTHFLNYAELELHFFEIVTGGLTTLNYNSATCTAFPGYGSTCSVTNVKKSGHTDSEADSRLIIYLTVDLAGTSYDRKYRIVYFNNALETLNQVNSY